MKRPWRERLYSAYVSSGQAKASFEQPTEHFASRQPYIQRVIRQYVPTKRKSRILDLGCGHGDFLYFLKKAGYQNIHGVDVSSEQVALARKLGIECIEQQLIDLYLSSVENESVDVILLMDVLEHLTRQELFDLLDEVARVLRPDGRCIAHVPNAAGLFGMRVRYGDLTHEMAFTPQSARQAFLTAGFHQVQCFEDKPVVHGGVSAVRRLLWDLGTWPYRLLLAAETGGISGVLSQNMLIIAEKLSSSPDQC